MNNRYNLKKGLKYLVKSYSFYLCLSFIALLATDFMIGCTSEKPKTNNQQKRKVSHDSTYDDIVWRDYNRIIGLLSIKNGIPETVVKPIILEYLRINNPSEYFGLTLNYPVKDTSVFDHVLKPIESIDKTIQRLSEKYSIKSDTIGILLFDFEIWSKLREIKDDVKDNQEFRIANELLNENEN